jgi:hypothetical protein
VLEPVRQYGDSTHYLVVNSAAEQSFGNFCKRFCGDLDLTMVRGPADVRYRPSHDHCIADLSK